MPHVTEPELNEALWALHDRVVRALDGALDVVINADPTRIPEVRTDHRLIERALRELEHAALVRMVESGEDDSPSLTRYLKVGVQMAQIGDLARAMALLTSSKATAVELDSASIVHAVGGRVQERLAAAVSAFADVDIEVARALEPPDPTLTVLLDRLQDIANRRKPEAPVCAKSASHLNLIDALIRSIAGLTRAAGAPAGLFLEG